MPAACFAPYVPAQVPPASMAERATAATEMDLSPEILLATCQKELTPAELNLVRSQLDLLVDKRLVLPEGIQQYSALDLVGFGLLPGVAAALKRAFPTPGVACRALAVMQRAK